MITPFRAVRRLADLVAVGLLSVRVARLKPGDVIVLTLSSEPSPENVDRIRRYILDVWPDHRVIVLGPSAALSITRGPFVEV